MLINGFSQNNSVQNFGFKVKVKENSKLVDMADSYLFRTVSREAIDEFQRKAADIFPKKEIHLDYSIWQAKPRECFEVNILSDGKLADSSLGHNAGSYLKYLRKTFDKYSTLHSRVFYDGQKSPETLMKVERFRETINRPFSRR